MILRILFCNYEYPPLGGGGGVINALLAEELAKKHDVTVLTSRCMGLPEESVENGVRIIRLPVMPCFASVLCCERTDTERAIITQACI